MKLFSKPNDLIAKRQKRFIAFFFALLLICLPSINLFAKNIEVDCVDLGFNPDEEQFVDVPDCKGVQDLAAAGLWGAGDTLQITNISHSGGIQLYFLDENYERLTDYTNELYIDADYTDDDNGDDTHTFVSPSDNRENFTGWKFYRFVPHEGTQSADMYFTAVYHYTVSFNMNGHGTAPTTQTVNTSEYVVKPANPTASGYTFGGWYTDSACTNAWDFDSDPVTEDITLFAKWTKNIESIATAKVTLAKSAYTYNGKVIKPSVSSVKLNGKTLVKGRDYTVTYKNYKNAGKGYVTITGKGNYKGTVKQAFTITKASVKFNTTKKSYKYKTVKKKAQSFTAFKNSGKGKVTVTYYKNGKISKKACKKYISVKSNGKVYVKKGAPKGTYKIKVKVAGTKNYNMATKTITITVK